MIRQHCKTITHVTNIKNAGLSQVWNTSSETPVRSRRSKAQGQAGGDSVSNGRENGHGLNGHGLNGQDNDSLHGSSTDEGSFLVNNGATSTVPLDAEVTLVQTLNIPDGSESVPPAQATPVEVSPSSSLPARAPPVSTPASPVSFTPAFASSERNGKEPNRKEPEGRERNSGKNEIIDWSLEEEEHEDDIDYEIKVLMADKLRAEAKFYHKANQTFDMAGKVAVALAGVTLAALSWLIHRQIGF